MNYHKNISKNTLCHDTVIADLDSERSRTMTRNLLVKCILA